MDEMLKLQENIELNNFTKLLDLCFEISSYFSFTKNIDFSIEERETRAKFLKELEPFYVKTIKTQHWHCYYVPPENVKEVYLFKTDMNAKPIIQKYFDNIFLEERNYSGDIVGEFKPVPEDLCFFYQNKLLLGTVSHENICYAYPHSEQLMVEFEKLGYWKRVLFSDEEQVSI
ncbi:MAG: hypothetical protein VB018_05870 [Lachnospiraceae bacterium]|nr:hypothetical protein [Lachnospiraceae bacterium]